MSNLRVIALVLFIFHTSIYADIFTAYKTNPYDFDIDQQNNNILTLKDAIQAAVQNNLDIQKSRLEILQSELPELQLKSKYNWKVYGFTDVYKATMPSNRSNFLSGNKISKDSVGAGIEKIFEQGMYLNLEASSTRYDTNAFENPATPATFKPLGIPPLYTGAFKVRLGQELLKNSFGVTDKNTFQILKHSTDIRKESLVLQLTGLVSDTLIKYWMLEVQDFSVVVFTDLLNNSKNLQKTKTPSAQSLTAPVQASSSP